MTRRRRFGFGCVVLCVVAGARVSASQSCVAPPPLPIDRVRAGAGGLTAVVTDAQGCPLVVLVSVSRTPEDLPANRIARPKPDSLGRFRLDSLPTGTLWVHVRGVNVLEQRHELSVVTGAIDTLRIILRRSRFGLSPVGVGPPVLKMPP